MLWIERIIAEVVPALYRDPRFAAAVVAFKGLESTVFFTSVFSGWTVITFVNTGRAADALVGADEESDFDLSTGTGGWLIGWLSIVFTSLSRSCAKVVVIKKVQNKMATPDRNEIFLKLFKTNSPVDCGAFAEDRVNRENVYPF